MYPYTKFGFNLWRLREAKGKSSKDMSTHLELALKEYQSFEMGKILPDETRLKKIASFLKTDLHLLKSWVVLPSRKIERGKVLPCLVDFQKRLDADIESIKATHKKNTNATLSTEQLTALGKLKSHVAEMIDLPVLPMNFILICDALNSVESQQYKNLAEYHDFITRGESLAGFLSRDLYFGPFLFFAANQLYFSEHPYHDLEQCFNDMTFTQLRHLFLLSCAQNGIYEIDTDIPRLQQHVDFSSLACLFARELKKEFGDSPPADIDFNILYQACLLQGVGQYVLFEQLKPSIVGLNVEYIEPSDDNTHFTGLDTQLFKETLWGLHATVSAIMGANWLFEKEVLDILLTHHDHPVSRVSPNTALLKIINFFVDKDFPKIEMADLDDMMKAYPQVKISTEVLHKVCLRLSNIKNDLYERSSTLLENANQNFAGFATTESANTKKNPHIATQNNLQTPLKRSDFRFDSKFQGVLKNVAHQRYENLLLETLLPRKNESLKMLTDRQTAFNLSLRFLLTKTVEDVAKEFGLSIDETLIRLQNLKT